MKNLPASLAPLLHILNLPSCRHIALSIVAYLSADEISAISQVLARCGQENYFLTLVQNFDFINNYLNRTDKSLYFPFYAEDEYHHIEINQIAAIAEENSNCFLQYHVDIDSLLAALPQLVPAITDEVDLLKNLIVDPDLPLPKLKRETEGMFCSSPFQLFLVDSTYRDEDGEEDFSCFEQLQAFLTPEKEEEYLRQFLSLAKGKQKQRQLRSIMQLRYTPYEITAQNHKEFLIPNNELHNFIVSLYALTDVMVEATHAYLSHIHDPLQRLIELLLRYSIYRNYVLAIEEYLSFAFKIYDNLYREAIEDDPKKPRYRFWRAALTKWYLKMCPLQREGEGVYMHCLTKLRNRHLSTQLKEMCEEDEARYGKIYNSLQLNHYEYTLAEDIFKGELNTSSAIGSFFDTHPENYEVVVMEFSEYLIDVSVNETTVHWCGHSKHQLEQPYLAFQEKLMQLNEHYISSLVKPAGDSFMSKVDVHALVKIDLEYLSILQVKNRTLSKIKDALNKNLQLQGEHELAFNFEEADKKLEYFNKKALILAEIDQNQRPFYSIPPHCSAKDLIDMIDTNGSQNDSDSQIYEYRSESGDEQKFKYEETGSFKYEQVQEQQGEAGKKPKSHKLFLEDYSMSTSGESEAPSLQQT